MHLCLTHRMNIGMIPLKNSRKTQKLTQGRSHEFLKNILVKRRSRFKAVRELFHLKVTIKIIGITTRICGTQPGYQVKSGVLWKNDTDVC